MRSRTAFELFATKRLCAATPEPADFSRPSFPSEPLPEWLPVDLGVTIFGVSIDASETATRAVALPLAGARNSLAALRARKALLREA